MKAILLGILLGIGTMARAVDGCPDEGQPMGGPRDVCTVTEGCAIPWVCRPEGGDTKTCTCQMPDEKPK